MIINSVLLDMDLQRAFALVTCRVSEWCPEDLRHIGDRNSSIFLLASGRFYERAGDGREIDLGKVTLWNKPHVLVLDFYVATGPDHPTEVEIRFEAEEAATRVTVIHRPKFVGRALAALRDVLVYRSRVTRATWEALTDSRYSTLVISRLSVTNRS